MQHSHKTEWQIWEEHALRSPAKEAIVFKKVGEEDVRWTFSSLVLRANQYSNLLHSFGVKPGEVCAIIIKHNPEFYPIYLGVVGLGAIPAVLAYPNPRLHPDKFRSGLLGMTQRSGLDYILTESSLEEILLPLIKDEKSTVKGVYFPIEVGGVNDLSSEPIPEIVAIRNNVSPDEPVLLQHSSGTTGLQKPIVLSHKAVLTHCENYYKALGVKAEDDHKVVSWLPLYHDMGLIAAFHLPLAFGIPSIQIDPFEWVVAPMLLLEAISQEKATLCWIPNFAFNIMADKIDDDELDGIDLSSMAMLMNCSEPVRYESHKRFLARFKQYGFREDALHASYGMAEITFLLTQTRQGHGPALFYADRELLAQGIVKKVEDLDKARICMSSGVLLPGCDAKIVDEQYNEISSDRVGEIIVRSESIFDGYRNYPEKTAEAFIDGWYKSGDYAFVVDGEFFVIGRKKDIIIVAGKNIYPEDLEDTVSGIDDVLPGRVIAFGEYSDEIGTEEICVIAETQLESVEEKKALKKRIFLTLMAIDVSPRHIFLVPSRWLIKSSAGKPSRSGNKSRLAELKENYEL